MTHFKNPKVNISARIKKMEDSQLYMKYMNLLRESGILKQSPKMKKSNNNINKHKSRKL